MSKPKNEMSRLKFEKLPIAEKIVWSRVRVSIMSDSENNFYFKPPHKRYKYGVFVPASLLKLALSVASIKTKMPTDIKNKISYYVALKDAKAAAEVFAEEFKANGINDVWISR